MLSTLSRDRMLWPAVVIGLALPVPGAAQPSANRFRVDPQLKQAAGYYPPNDPESLSVVIGRRTNAPRVAIPFTGGERSLEEVGRALCRGIHSARRDSLERLCITRTEFERILWREFPESRPITGLRAEDAWFLLEARNAGGIGRTIDGYAGRRMDFVRWDRADTVARFRNFRLHDGLTLVVVNHHGVEERLDVVRAIAERNGRFKIYSLKD